MERFNPKQGFMPCPANCGHSVAWHIHDDQTVKCEYPGCICEVPYIVDAYPEFSPTRRDTTLGSSIQNISGNHSVLSLI